MSAELAERGILREYIGRYIPGDRAWERQMRSVKLTRKVFDSGPGRRIGPPGLERAKRSHPGALWDFAAGFIPLAKSGTVGRQLYGQLLSHRDKAILRTALAHWNGRDAVIANHSMALEIFEKAHAAGRQCIVNFPLAHPLYLNEILEEEAALHPEFSADLLSQGSDQERLDRLEGELALADCVLVGSSFAMKSFTARGVPPEKIFTSSYGVNIDQFSTERSKQPDGTFRVIYVGQITQRKGIRYLLEAWRRVQGPGMELVLAGAFTSGVELYAPWHSLFRHAGFLSPEGLRELFQTADVLVLPSLVEGMPLVVLQAMAARIPVIVTANGPGDVVRDGLDGFHIPIRSPEAIADRIIWMRDHPEERVRMGNAAHERALTFTWQRYRTEVADYLEPFFNF